MSVKLTTNLSQRLVLTPQLRQRIEMLQMTTLELSELIQQQLLENPVLEEVPSQEETQELAEKILDQLADGDTGSSFDLGAAREGSAADFNGAPENGAGEADADAVNLYVEPEGGVASGEEGGGEAGEDSAPDDAGLDAFEEIDFGREFQDYLDPGYKTQEFEYKEDAPTFEQFLTRPPSLSEHLELQLHLNPISEEVCDVALCVIGNLDADGRLTATNEEIAAMGGYWSEELVEKARQTVMRLDPVGCGARDARECLLTQLEARGESDRLAARLISDHLLELQQHKLPNLSKQLGIDVETLIAEVQFIRTLDPYPGRRYSSEEPVLISPEIYIEKLDDEAEDWDELGGYVIYFADDGSPRLRISQNYQQMLSQQQTTKETRDFIRDKMRSAVDLLRNIEHRRQTIYKVVESIIKRQKEFLDKGVQYIKPMMLKDIAEDIGMHLSTVSRVVNRKYAHTPQGVIELRRFFTEGMMNEEGEEVSTRIIKLKIKKLIEEEDSHNPITDDQIVKILIKDGIKLSRRTVAKYRDQMNIPGSRERRAPV
jgi:RNA polymerase sigma-54 factor